MAKPYVAIWLEHDSPQVLALMHLTGNDLHTCLGVAVLWFKHVQKLGRLNQIEEDGACTVTRDSFFAAIRRRARRPKQGRLDFFEAFQHEAVDWIRVVSPVRIVVQRYRENFSYAAQQKIRDSANRAEKRHGEKVHQAASRSSHPQAEAVVAALVAARVHDYQRKEDGRHVFNVILENHEVTPMAVKRVAARVDAEEGIKHRNSVIVYRLLHKQWTLNGYETAKQVCDHVEKGLIVSINGSPVTPDAVGHNSLGLTLKGELFLPTDRIKEARYE